MITKYPNDRNDSPIAMVAEEDSRVRIRIADFLRDKGYVVLEARTSMEALLMAVEFPDRIDALFTSLEFSQYGNGPELAGCLQAFRPGMSVFYLGGMAPCSEEVTRQLVLGEAILLRKPVSDSRMNEAVGMLEEIRDRVDGFPLKLFSWMGC